MNLKARFAGLFPFATLATMTLVGSVCAQESQILSLRQDGTLTWTNSQTNGYCGFEFTEELPGRWASAPDPYWNLRVTSVVMTATVPMKEIQARALYLRLASSTNPLPRKDMYDVEGKGIPQFVEADYIELAKIARLSRFRSGEGHDYSDDFESCRSMKHYFEPAGAVDWAGVRIHSPVAGTVDRLEQEWAGTQVRIQSREFPAFYFIVFHVKLGKPLTVGESLAAGQVLGTHVGNETTSDIAVGVNTPKGWKLVSYFEVMADALFDRYRLRGLSARSDAIISKEARDNQPLACTGETFQSPGTIANWVPLH